jgi:hypothetical protein
MKARNDLGDRVSGRLRLRSPSVQSMRVSYRVTFTRPRGSYPPRVQRFHGHDDQMDLWWWQSSKNGRIR